MYYAQKRQRVSRLTPFPRSRLFYWPGVQRYRSFQGSSGNHPQHEPIRQDVQLVSVSLTFCDIASTFDHLFPSSNLAIANGSRHIDRNRDRSGSRRDQRRAGAYTASYLPVGRLRLPEFRANHTGCWPTRTLNGVDGLYRRRWIVRVLRRSVLQPRSLCDDYHSGVEASHGLGSAPFATVCSRRNVLRGLRAI